MQQQLTLDIWMRKRSTKTEKPGRSWLVAMPQYTEFSKSCSCLFRKCTKWVSSDHDGFNTPQYLEEKSGLLSFTLGSINRHHTVVLVGLDGIK